MSDPTDPGGVGAAAERSRATRVGDSGSPVGSPLTIVLALVAVIVGFLIFRSIDDSDAGGIDTPEGSTTLASGVTTTVAGGSTATTASTATTVAAARVTEGATVIVANASAAGGEAQNTQDGIAELGYSVTDEATSDSNEEPLEESLVFFTEGVPAIRAVADSLARDLGGLTVQPMPSPVPIEGGLGTATVLVMMGNDLAGEPVEDLAQGAAPNVAAPAPAGQTTTT